MKKIISVSIIMILLFSVCFISGCFKVVEYGDFRCKFRETLVDIEGLSEEGKNKEVIFIPEKINGCKVKLIGRVPTTTALPADFSSDKLKRLYLEINFYLGNTRFKDVKNLEKVFILGLPDGPGALKELPVPTFTKKSDVEKYEGIRDLIPANISYFYNYEGAPNDGYYWIDDVENGETIKYIPENPIREGYLFGGWFKDEACTEVWDFEKDTIVKPADGYYENILYAKWNKKNF